jgi:hypothetical protein
VTVRADHVTLLDLGDQLVARHEDSVSAGNGEEFLAWIAMIEVHYVRREHLFAVLTGDSSEVTEKCERCLLASLDAFQFRFAMRCVVLDVVATLNLGTAHIQAMIEQPFYQGQGQERAPSVKICAC